MLDDMDDMTKMLFWGAAAYVAYELLNTPVPSAPVVHSSAPGQFSLSSLGYTGVPQASSGSSAASILQGAAVSYNAASNAAPRPGPSFSDVGLYGNNPMNLPDPSKQSQFTYAWAVDNGRRVTAQEASVDAAAYMPVPEQKAPGTPEGWAQWGKCTNITGTWMTTRDGCGTPPQDYPAVYYPPSS